MKILVIRLGALGDVILSFATFRAIREHHPDAHITFLTSPAFKSITAGSPYFDDIITFERQPFWKIGSWLRLIKFFSKTKYDFVYDIQRNDRTRLYRGFSAKDLQKVWLSGDKADYLRNPLALDASDIMVFAQPPLDWMKKDLSHFNLPNSYVLLVPGSAPQHPAKRWPAEHYAELAKKLSARGLTPVLIGTAAEADTAALIAAACPEAINLTARTAFTDIATLAFGAQAAIGNDTGPMHLISLCSCPVVSLFSHASDPAKSAPRGKAVAVLRAHPIENINVDDVITQLKLLIEK